MIGRLVRPLRRNDPRTLVRTVADDPRSVCRHLAGSRTRVLPERDVEVPPTPSQVRGAVAALFPDVAPDDRLDFWLELHDDRAFRSAVESRLAATDAGPDRLHANWREFLYVFVRHARPSVVVETGVRGGLSSAYLLAALDANGSGRLVSVDIGDESLVPDDVTTREPGWLVPEGLRSRWELRLGDSEALVDDVLAEHDAGLLLSDVPNESLVADLSAARRRLDPGGLVVTCLPDGSDARATWREFAADGVESHTVGSRWRDGDDGSEVVVGVVGGAASSARVHAPTE